MDYKSMHTVTITFSKQELIDALLKKSEHYNSPRFYVKTIEPKKGGKMQLVLVERVKEEHEKVINYSVTAD